MIYLIANEKHVKGKNSKKLDIVRGVFDRAGKKYEVLLTHKTGDAKAHAERITADGEKNIVVALGGDGTLHDIINGFKDFENNSLGLIPLGTGNDFAATAEMGIDVDVLERVYSGNMTGKSKYAKALVSSLKHFNSRKFTVKYDGNEEELFGLICAICNGRQLGGGMKICPQAKLNDGYIELFLCDYISKSRIVGMFLKLMTGNVRTIKEARSIKVKSATIIPHAEDYYLQADGEIYPNVPFDVYVVSDKLKFYLPAKI